MRTALITLVDDNFVQGLEVFLRSLRANNPWFDLPFIVLDLGLTELARARVLAAYDKIELRQIQKENYRKINFSKTHPRLRNTYYTFDVFLQSDFDRLVFMDMDTLVLGDIRELFGAPEGFSAAKCYDAKRDCMRNDFNSGVFTVTKPYLNESVYHRLVEMAQEGHSMPDQAVLNRYFGPKMRELPKIYNVEKRMLHTERLKDVFNAVKVLHFVAAKPWQQDKPESERRYGSLEKIWWEYEKL